MKITSLLLLPLVLSSVGVGLSARAAADTTRPDVAHLQVNGDLIMHPDQMAGFFQLAADRIKSSDSWQWPEMRFTRPYRTAWTQVQARGPFDITFDSTAIKNQEVSFEFNWDEPAIHIGQFQIDDTITRTIGGVNIIIHLAGQCNGMTVTVPSGQWKVKGRLAWDWNGTQVSVRWLDFAFAMNPNSSLQADLGQCQGPSGLRPALQEAFDSISRDQSWLQDVLREGVMNWIENSLTSMQGELLKARTVTLKPGMDLTWQPDGLAGIPGGLVRVSGHLDLNRAGLASGGFETLLDRSYSDASLASIQESGFVLPKTTLQTLLSFLYRTGDLRSRITSDQVASFASLMQSRLLQFFIWPDLLNFSQSTVFHFDLATSNVPKLSNGVMRPTGGVSYNLAAPLLVQQWAPYGRQYLPYIDFSGNLGGRLDAYVKNQKLNLHVSPSNLSVGAVFRPETAAVRSENTWIATSLLGSEVSSYIGGMNYSFDIPQWDLGGGMTLGIRDLQAWKQSFRIPLQLKNSK